MAMNRVATAHAMAAITAAVRCRLSQTEFAQAGML
jgi:hypothetical protein